MTGAFARFASAVSEACGSVWAFVLAAAAVAVWAMTGPLFGYSEVWQLVINTGTTIVTFLMVFLIQNTQNRDTKAVHKKLDEIIVKLPQTDSRLAGIEKKLGNEGSSE